MSRQPIALSPDLRKLRDEGYDLDIRNGYLLVQNVPSVDSIGAVRSGTLITKLSLAGDITCKPTDHVAYWSGEHPCHADGTKIRAFENPSRPPDMGEGLKADFTFSAKADYRDYYHKVTTYVGRIAGEAAKVNPSVTAQAYRPVPEEKSGSPFKYVDTASSRSGTSGLNARIAKQSVGIIGLGGSGAYVLDLVAKTEVAEIHLFDGDQFSQHNAFRAPGAPSLEDLAARPTKVAWFDSVYSKMRHGIHPHAVFVREDNLHLLDDLDFVFVCVDSAADKCAIINHLTRLAKPFVETGMGLLLNDGVLTGLVRVASSTPETRDLAAPHISYADAEGLDNEYASNIQIVELNALSAAVAVYSWKRILGFYPSIGRPYYHGFSIVSGEFAVEVAP